MTSWINFRIFFKNLIKFRTYASFYWGVYLVESWKSELRQSKSSPKQNKNILNETLSQFFTLLWIKNNIIIESISLQTLGQSNDLIKKWIINGIAMCQTISDYNNQMKTLSKLLFDCMRQAEKNGTSTTS